MKKLYRRFMSVAILSLLVVITLVLVTLNCVNYAKIYKDSYEIIDEIKDNGGKISYEEHNESRYAIRYFTVIVTENTQDVNTSAVHSISKDQALKLTMQKRDEGKSQGVVYIYGNAFLYRISEGKQVTAVFMDITNQLEKAKHQVNMSIVIGISVFFVFVIIFYMFSGLLMRPFIKNYEKQKEFITNASHELKTPLAIISANNEVMEMMSGENEWSKSTHEQIERLNKLISNLISMARFQENQHFVLEDVDSSSIVKQSVEDFIPLANKQEKTLRYDISENMMVKTDLSSFKEVVHILLDNAIKYCDDGGHIDVSLKKKGRNVIFKVENDYHDLSVDPETFFDRFYREDTSHHQEGYGIGLSMAKSIIEGAGGKIKVHYRKKKISFEVIL
jgi:signal transduction histidine kinase